MTAEAEGARAQERGIELTRQQNAASVASVPNVFGVDTAQAARAFHQSIPGYRPTPLVALPGLAGELGVASIHVKDESQRFGLNAFKGLGGSYAIARLIGERLDVEPAELSYEPLTSDAAKAQLGNLTFITATDGNHGRGVAWTARMLGQRAVVYMPAGSAPERLENIRALGAEAEICDLNYDDTVRLAARTAEERGWILVQDTSWPGYEKIPTWIMQGYTTMALEAAEELAAAQEPAPTHVFLQAGVGAMSGAVTGFLASYYAGRVPKIVIVEPHAADCVFRTAQATDGKLHTVGGDLNTMMAGLACGEVCHVGWNMLGRHAGWFASAPDETAARGMRVLAAPTKGDAQVISGESGAAGVGLAATLLDGNHQKQAEQLDLNCNSRILCFSTEGATDQANFRKVVWGF